MTSETVIGNLENAYRQIVPGTMLHADRLMNERRINPINEIGEDLRKQWFYTADGIIYLLKCESKTPTLAITREAHNPVLQHIDDAIEQLAWNSDYHPGQAYVQDALAAPDTVLLALPDLRLSGNDPKWSYLEVGTTPAEYNRLNGEERKLAERAYGQENDFVENMKMLKDANINETKIFVFNPIFVCKQAGAGAIACVSWLSYFVSGSNFCANIQGISNRFHMRGARRFQEMQ